MYSLNDLKTIEITAEEIANMDLGFKKGRIYDIYGNSARDKDKPVMKNAIYISESGVKNDFLIFKSKAHGFHETFLKKDILFRIYKAVEVRNFVTKKTGS